MKIYIEKLRSERMRIRKKDIMEVIRRKENRKNIVRIGNINKIETILNKQNWERRKRKKKIET